MKVELTGQDDRKGPWKIAIAGQPGSGKTMLSSTAPDPLFVFFQHEPRIKSVADRMLPHVKLVNDFTNSSYALDQMNALIMHLELQDHDYKTLVIDTGDEFFQQMKAGRAHQNGGEFAIGDWGWIADAYREVMQAIIDLHMNVIVTFHTKNTTDDDHSFKELMLQGQAKDEATGWFDIVGALDTFTIVDDHGSNITKRVLLTSSSRTYSWVKDHSGNLPSRFEISEHFTNDVPRILELASASTGSGERQVIAEIPDVAPMPAPVNADIPSPEELDARKREVLEVSESQPAVEAVSPTDKQDAHVPDPDLDENEGATQVADEAQPHDAVDSQANVESDTPTEPPSVASGTSMVSPDDGRSHPVQSGVAVSDEQALAEVQEKLGAELVTVCAYVDPSTGEKCGVDVTDDVALQEITQIRFREYLCRPHFKLKLDS